jgi:hypothetical protein
MRVAALVFVAGVAVASAVAWTWWRAWDDPAVFGPAHHPSDAALIANFQRHRLEFERLRAMVAEDTGLTAVLPDRTVPADPQTVGVRPSRIDEYRKLLDQLGIRGGLEVKQPKTVQLTNSSHGFVTHSSQKGYLYTEELDKLEVFPELNDLSAKEIGNGVRHIEGNWYLFFEGY